MSWLAAAAGYAAVVLAFGLALAWLEALIEAPADTDLAR